MPSSSNRWVWNSSWFHRSDLTVKWWHSRMILAWLKVEIYQM
jgi:hypothetical protein